MEIFVLKHELSRIAHELIINFLLLFKRSQYVY